ncbi:MAG TPA: hypothetical protein VIS99_08715, partial [Terrimicrobiaceae bacterium]
MQRLRNLQNSARQDGHCPEGQETILAFLLGTLAGLSVGLWLGLSHFASALLAPYIKAANAMPRVVLAPIFMVWFGLGIWSKVALGFTLVFFIVF